MAKPCPSKCTNDKVCNPLSGRCILKNGRLAKSILGTTTAALQSSPCNAVCSNDKVCNPSTGRCVKKDGKMGRSILGTSSSTQRNLATTSSTTTQQRAYRPFKTSKREYVFLTKQDVLARASKLPEPFPFNSKTNWAGQVRWMFGRKINEASRINYPKRHLQALRVGDIITTIEIPLNLSFPDKESYHRQWSKRESFIKSYRVVQEFGPLLGLGTKYYRGQGKDKSSKSRPTEGVLLVDTTDSKALVAIPENDNMFRYVPSYTRPSAYQGYEHYKQYAHTHPGAASSNRHLEEMWFDLADSVPHIVSEGRPIDS